jgi:4,5-dihydroxyphthalate decarboxylase
MSAPLRTAIGDYPHTRALKSGAVRSDVVAFDFAEVAPINRAFAPMVREQKFDVCEIAIATYFQARAFGKLLVLLPIVLAARFQQSALLCRADADIAVPRDLAGRRVGVRAYSQTTGVWLRGMLADDHGLRPDDIRWVTFEDAHVAEFRDPPFAARAPAGADMLAMLRAGELDAVIVGNDPPADPSLRPVFARPEEEAAAFWAKHRFVPVNHMVCMRAALASQEAVAELTRLFGAARTFAPTPADGRDPFAATRESLAPALGLALRYTQEQGLLPRPLSVAELWRRP